MPIARVSSYDGPDIVAREISTLEADGNEVVHYSQVGNEFLILYKPKPKVGRPRKVESREAMAHPTSPGGEVK